MAAASTRDSLDSEMDKIIELTSDVSMEEIPTTAAPAMCREIEPSPLWTEGDEDYMNMLEEEVEGITPTHSSRVGDRLKNKHSARDWPVGQAVPSAGAAGPNS